MGGTGLLESGERRPRALLVVGLSQVGWIDPVHGRPPGVDPVVDDLLAEVLEGAFHVVTARWSDAEQAYGTNLDLICMRRSSKTLYGHKLIVAIRNRPELADVPMLIVDGRSVHLPGGVALRELLSSLPAFPHECFETPFDARELLDRAVALARRDPG